MHLTREECEMLEGKHGYPVQKSMEILVGLGECYDAERMLPINSAHLLYNIASMGKGGILFIHEMAEKGGKFIVHTDTNPASIEPWLWKELGFSEQFVQEHLSIVNDITKMGALLADTCAPYLVGHVPRMGEHKTQVQT